MKMLNSSNRWIQQLLDNNKDTLIEVKFDDVTQLIKLN